MTTTDSHNHTCHHNNTFTMDSLSPAEDDDRVRDSISNGSSNSLSTDSSSFGSILLPLPPLLSPQQKFPPSSKLRKKKGKPSIIDEPQLVELCEHYTITRNITGLSLILRQKGLPPHLRHKVWPLLLKSHPFVLRPYILPDEDEEELDEQEIKQKIKEDLKKYFKRSRNHIDMQNNGNQNTQNHSESSEIQELLKKEDEMIKVMQYSILRFLKKWGSLINYHSGLTWIALGLAEWIPPIPSVDDESSNYVLCGREFINKNGPTCLKNVNDELNDYLNYSNYIDDDIFFMNNRNHSPSSSASIYSSNVKKSETTVSDDSSVLSVATVTTNTSRPHQLQPQPQKHSPLQSKNLSFAEIYERMVLVILHSPKPSEDSSSSENGSTSDKNEHNNSNNSTGHDYENDSDEESPKEKILTTLPVKGGTPEERISFFLYCLRRLLPELLQFFIDEDILNTTTVKDDWIVWWLKWCGAKVWSKYDRGRLWDILLGWRKPDTNVSQEDLDDLILDDEIAALLGPDIFWHPLALEEDEGEEGDKGDGNNDNNDSNDDRRGSIKTLISSLSSASLSKLNQEQRDSDTQSQSQIRSKIPFSHLDPHTEMVFISLSFIKSKEFALLELDQSEIREFLNKLSSTKLYGFQNLFEDEMSQSNSKKEASMVLEGGAGVDHVSTPDAKYRNIDLLDENRKTIKNGLRDIENILVESGELWRKWIWQEVSD